MQSIVRSSRLVWGMVGLLIPTFAFGQTVTTVRIAASGFTVYSKDACTAVTKTSISTPTATKDTLIVRIQGDQNNPSKAPEDLLIAVGSAQKTLAKGDDNTTIDGKVGAFTGEVIVATQKGATLVCALDVPPVDAPAQDSLSRAFRVGIGASFDFLSGLKANDVYADATVFLPGLWKRLGIDGGLWNGRTTGSKSSVDTLRQVVGLNAKADTVITIIQQIRRTGQLSTDQLSQYITPFIQIRKSFSWAVHVEGIKSDIQLLNSTAVRAADTTRAPKPTGYSHSPTPVDVDTVKTSSYAAWFGTGPMIQHRWGALEFRTKSVAGRTFNKDGWQPWAYVLQFRVTDFENGFKLGGDIRGPFRSSDPTVVVYLSKDFAFKRFADFFAGGDKGTK